MTTFLQEVYSDLLADEEDRPRSKQTTTGGSQLLGACRAETVLRINGVPKSDPRLSWQAFVGSAIDSRAGKARQRRHPHLLVQHTTWFGGVPFTIDEFDPYTATLTDWKTKDTAAKAATAARKVTDQQRAQIHGGAAGLIAEGWTVRTVRLAFFPRAGGFEPTEFVEPFSQKWADLGVAWAQEVDGLAREIGEQVHADLAAIADEGDGPNPEPRSVVDFLDGLRDENPRFCNGYCPYVSLCRGVPGTEWVQDVAVETAPDLTAVDVEAYELIVAKLPRIQVRGRAK